MNIKKTALCAAISTAMGVFSASALADTINATFSGWLTMIQPSGSAAIKNGDATGQAFYGYRTAVSGTMSFDTATGAGGANIDPFSFFGVGAAVATAVSFQAVGDGLGGPGTLVLGNMGFNWSGNNGIPISIVMDASGFIGAVAGGLSTSDTVSGTGALAATDDFLFVVKNSYTLPLGPIPMATTTFNTTNIGTIALGTNPSGTLPFTDDGIGGSPMQGGPFPGFNANFDITSIHIVSAVPVPAAAWLFGSGLLGLIGISRGKRT